MTYDNHKELINYRKKFIFTTLMLRWDPGQKNLEEVYRVNFGEVIETEQPCKKTVEADGIVPLN